ncbi:MAG: metallophosphoesterase [Clostridia bacterium]|nr:metallophosphoesterase [Clostridia bacterium]
MKKTLAIVLCALTVCLSAASMPAYGVSGAGTAAAAADGFVPVIRFIASSDTHVKVDDGTNAGRIGKMLELGYGIAEADPSYASLDAVLVVGDLTDRGVKPAFDIFWEAMSSSLRDGTRFLGVVAKNHDGYDMKRAELRDYYTSLTGCDADFNVVINGYHFIGLSASPLDGVHYSASQLSWLRKQLAEAAAEDPDRPIFFMNHEPALGTVYGSSAFDGWGIPTFNAILNRYPQVVHFAGHSHYPVNDPRSVWQGAYTAVGTGAIYYAEFTIDSFRAYDPPDCREAANCWIVELDKDSNMRLRGYDVEEAELLCEVYLENPADRNNRDYTPAAHEARSKAPVFASGAAAEVEPSFGGCTVSVPAAISTDGEPIVLYRAFAKDGSGRVVSGTWTLPYYYRAIEQDTIGLTLEGLKEGEYTICVVAENAYGKQSEPLETKVTVEGETGFRAFFMRLKYLFERLITVIKRLFW